MDSIQKQTNKQKLAWTLALIVFIIHGFIIIYK